MNKRDLDFWIKNEYNVILRGRHGVGKTAIIKEAFEDAGLKWLYFSAPTMDPWVDFIGIPKEKTDEDGNVFLDLVRPKHFENDEVEAIFLDEFNRAPKKVRNAVMELIQFKSINGKKFHNLKIIWAGINPEDEDQTYDVEKLDPAQLDRFHICVDVPYKPNMAYFSKKYGKENANVAIAWWNEEKEVKELISPRRLDYALAVHLAGGDLRDVLPNKANSSKLIRELISGPVLEKLAGFLDKNDRAGAKTFLSQENNFESFKSYIETPKFVEFFVPLLKEEKIISLMEGNKKVKEYVFHNFSSFEPMIKDIANADTSKLAKEAKKLVQVFGTALPKNKTYIAPAADEAKFWDHMLDYQKKIGLTTPLKKEYYKKFANTMPVDFEKDPHVAMRCFLELASCQIETLEKAMPDLGFMLNNLITSLVKKNKIKKLNEHNHQYERIYAKFEKSPSLKGTLFYDPQTLFG